MVFLHYYDVLLFLALTWFAFFVSWQRRHYLLGLREYHDNFVRNILVRKRPRAGGVVDQKPTTKKVSATRPIISGGNDYTDGWDEERIKRVIDYRRQVRNEEQWQSRFKKRLRDVE